MMNLSDKLIKDMKEIIDDRFVPYVDEVCVSEEFKTLAESFNGRYVDLLGYTTVFLTIIAQKLQERVEMLDDYEAEIKELEDEIKELKLKVTKIDQRSEEQIVYDFLKQSRVNDEQIEKLINGAYKSYYKNNYSNTSYAIRDPSIKSVLTNYIV